jgi:hypothetical protein
LSKLLTFELNEEGECLEIHGDILDIKSLVKALETAIETNDHVHMMTPFLGREENASKN